MSTDLKTAFKQILVDRHSCRGFLPEPLSKETVQSIVEDAQRACSNCNTQPWHTIVVSGEKLKELKAAYVSAFTTNGFPEGCMDFVFSADLFSGEYKERMQAQGAAMYGSLGIARDDVAGRTNSLFDQFKMFGAPHVALFFMPDIQEGNVRQAADIGQYAMTFMLSCAAHGVGSLPQTTLGMRSDVPRKLFNVPENYKMLFGVAFGHEDKDAAGNKFKMGRAPIATSVEFHE